ncbi:3,4-dihydroxy-2-butanone-4-phosphate synthase, partial [Vibrio parahaemolyticus V-223/04]
YSPMYYAVTAMQSAAGHLIKR